MSLQLFQKFVINGSRSTSTKTLQLLWDIIVQDSTFPDESNISFFFRLLLDFSGCEPDGIEKAADRLASHVSQIHSKNYRNAPVPLDSRALISWANEYAPYAAAVFVTYINHKCFHGIELNGYTPFCPPILERGSSVVSQSDVMPLALYDKSLQGRWKKLYTTQEDGLSFNRIAHHILGYGVIPLPPHNII
jgi:hypothetical protein